MTISTGIPIPAGLPTTAAPRHQPATGPADRSDPPVPRPADQADRSDVDEAVAPADPEQSDAEQSDAEQSDVEQSAAEAAGPTVETDAGTSATRAGGDGDAEAAPDSAAVDTDAVDTGPVPRLERLREALPALPGPGLTVAGGTLLGAVLVGLGAALDIALGAGLGLGFKVTFVVTCMVIACAVRVRALGAAVVLPPLLYAGAAVLQTVSSGQITGRRAAALDVATTLALTAPLLFLGTAVAAAIALSRGLVHLVRR